MTPSRPLVPPALAERAPSPPSPSTEDTTAPAYTPYAHQIAGHAGQILGLPDGLIAKVCPEKEVQFYQHLFASTRDDLKQFTAVVPRFDRAGRLGDDTEGLDFDPEDASKPTVHIENLLAPFSHPSVADIKIGTRLYGDEADDAKRARMEQQSRETTSGETGLRICGMKVYDPATSTYLTHDRKYGRSLTPQTLPTGVRTFFTVSNTSTLVSSVTLRAVRDKLTTLLQRLEKASVRLYGASVLLIYEGNMADARIIDFAHSHVELAEAGRDEGACFGVKNLLGMIEALLEERAIEEGRHVQ